MKILQLLKENKTIIIGLLGIILGIIIANTNPPLELTVEAMQALGIFAGAVIWWIYEVLPDYVTALLMCTSWVAFKVVPFNIAFASFSNATFWLLVGAFGIGVVVSKSGLLDRISLFILSKFPATFAGQTAALLISGNLIAPTIPSVTAKVAIVAPFAKSISDKLGYADKSKENAGIFSAMFMGFGTSGPIFLSASFMCYTMLGLLPENISSTVTWMSWLKASFIWGFIVLVGSYVAIQLLYKPIKPTQMDSTYMKEEFKNLGPLSKEEKMVLLVLSMALFLWMTEKVHGIAAAIVALTALCILLGLRIIDRTDFRTGIAWDSVIFIGGIINLATVFPALGIDRWIVSLIGPHMASLTANIYLFIALTAIIIYLVRLLIVSQIATVTIFTVLMTPFAIQAGINPFVPAFVILCSVNTWNVIYQNSTYLTAYYASGEMVDFPQTIKMSAAYMIISLIGLLFSIPLWKVIGMIP